MTTNQKNLFKLLKLCMTKVSPMHYDKIKALTEFKTFNNSFNVLLNKGYVKRFAGGNGENTYILTSKK